MYGIYTSDLTCFQIDFFSFSHITFTKEFSGDKLRYHSKAQVILHRLMYWWSKSSKIVWFNFEIRASESESFSFRYITFANEFSQKQPINRIKVENKGFLTIYRGEGIHLHKNAVAHNGPKVIFAAANVPKASNSIAHNGVTSFNVYQ